MPPPVPPRQFFETENSQGICAGYAIAWLTVSMIRGRAETIPGMIQSAGQIGGFYRDDRGRANRNWRRAPHMPLGRASLDVLPASGMRVLNDPGTVCLHSSWEEKAERLLQEPDGYFYLTTRGNGVVHAMACILDDKWVYYMEPQRGLFRIEKAGFPAWLAENFGHFNVPAEGSAYKIYRVEQA